MQHLLSLFRIVPESWGLKHPYMDVVVRRSSCWRNCTKRNSFSITFAYTSTYMQKLAKIMEKWRPQNEKQCEKMFFTTHKFQNFDFLVFFWLCYLIEMINNQSKPHRNTMLIYTVKLKLSSRVETVNFHTCYVICFFFI